MPPRRLGWRRYSRGKGVSKRPSDSHRRFFRPMDAVMYISGLRDLKDSAGLPFRLNDALGIVPQIQSKYLATTPGAMRSYIRDAYRTVMFGPRGRVTFRRPVGKHSSVRRPWRP